MREGLKLKESITWILSVPTMQCKAKLAWDSFVLTGELYVSQLVKNMLKTTFLEIKPISMITTIKT